jgi:hypothetical protein
MADQDRVWINSKLKSPLKQIYRGHSAINLSFSGGFWDDALPLHLALMQCKAFRHSK